MFLASASSLLTLRVGAAQEPQYRFAIGDDLPYSADEFQTGFEFVLTDPASWFTQKRICTRATPDGYKTLSERRFKVVRQGVAEEREVWDWAEWRRTLAAEFGVELSVTKSYDGATAAASSKL